MMKSKTIDIARLQTICCFSRGDFPNSPTRPPSELVTQPHSFSRLLWSLHGSLPARFSATAMLVINTGTTIATFLMVFLIQNTQNRDTLAIQLKSSELVRAMKGAENKFAAIEDLSDEELEELDELPCPCRDGPAANRKAQIACGKRR